MRPRNHQVHHGEAVQPARQLAGGNVETSQRMVDTLLRALAKAAPNRIPAASRGTKKKTPPFNKQYPARPV
jgi:N-methylhydantoinase B/oxoprolinase/acetone carboxylase alpha subunit